MARKKMEERNMEYYGQGFNVDTEHIKSLTDYEKAKDYINFKLIRRETNQQLLEDIPNLDMLDLAVIFYLDLGTSENGEMTAMIHNNHMEKWGVSKEELYDRAKENTSRLRPACIKPMEEVMLEILKLEGARGSDVESMELIMDREPQLYVLTNSNGLNGSACILYENCLSEFAKELEVDIVILPSSRHEVLLLPDRGELDYQELQEMVEYINKTEVAETDILSNKVYHYARLENKLTVIEAD